MESNGKTEIFDYNEILEALKDYAKNGIPTGFKTGVQTLDKNLKFDKGKLATITGIPGMGKSEFVDFICTQMNKLHKFKTLYFSAEDSLKEHLIKLCKKINFNEKYTDEDKAKYISENYKFINYENVYSVEKLFEVAEEEINRNYFDILVIAPFNKLEADKAYNVNMTDYISKFLDRLLRFTKRYNVLTFLVAHPKKMLNLDLIPSAYDIADSAHFFNKSDYCISIHARKEECRTVVKVDKVKYSYLGSCTMFELGYDTQTTNFFDVCQDSLFSKSDREDELFCLVAHEQQPKPNKQPKEAQRIEIAKAVLQEAESKINYNELMQTKVAYMDNVCAKQSDTITLQEALTKAASIQDKQAELRALTDKTEMQKYKRNNFPAITPSVVFNQDGTTKDNVKQINPIICIDIDGQDNNYMSTDRMKDIVSKINSVFYAQESASGKGIFCFVQVSDTNQFKGHFNALQDTFKSKGLIIDEQCSDINRKRFVAYDPNPYINRSATIYKDKKEDIIQQNTTTTPFYRSCLSDKTHQLSWPSGWSSYTDTQKAEYIVNQCLTKGILINKSHADSLTIASALKTIYHSTDTGLNYCLQLRQMRKGTDIAKQTYMYQTASTKTNAVGCLVNLYKSAIISQN